MPYAAPRSCSHCHTIHTGRCTQQAQQYDKWRGTDTQRGYGKPWARFVAWVKAQMVQQGIPLVCGATLHGGPNTHLYSQCQQQGLRNSQRLELDHEPPLTDEERHRAIHGDRSAIDDVRRVGFLCRACHSAKTLRQCSGKT